MKKLFLFIALFVAQISYAQFFPARLPLIVSNDTVRASTGFVLISSNGGGSMTGAEIITALGFTPVPTTRTINGNALSGNITLTASDVGVDTSKVFWRDRTQTVTTKNTFSDITTFTDTLLATEKVFFTSTAGSQIRFRYDATHYLLFNIGVGEARVTTVGDSLHFGSAAAINFQTGSTNNMTFTTTLGNIKFIPGGSVDFINQESSSAKPIVLTPDGRLRILIDGAEMFIPYYIP